MERKLDGNGFSPKNPTFLSRAKVQRKAAGRRFPCTANTNRQFMPGDGRETVPPCPQQKNPGGPGFRE
ncbi:MULTISPECIES: hypothetical protein [Fibrobacter]|uniref:hypothetical protein n=1 Tax=Fibrobacter TaxID=832 RepID=UPI00099A33FD|nr:MULTISPECIES: hypothetical protein [Fibrobacter]